MQEGDDKKKHVIQYGGRSLKHAESKYPSCELELGAILYALRDLQTIIFNVPVTIYTDNKALTYLQTMKHSNSRLYRWAIEIEEYDVKIIYKPGRHNAADFISRIKHKNVGEKNDSYFTDLQMLFRENSVDVITRSAAGKQADNQLYPRTDNTGTNVLPDQDNEGTRTDMYIPQCESPLVSEDTNIPSIIGPTDISTL